MSDTRPSIAELKLAFAKPHQLMHDEVIQQMDAAPLLIEIAAAALTHEAARSAYESSDAKADRWAMDLARLALSAALARVLP